MNNKTKKITVKSLIEKKEALLKKEPITAEFYVESLDGTVTLREPSAGIMSDIVDMDTDMGNKYVLYECMIEPNLKDAEIQEAFGKPTLAADVLDYILKPGEIARLSGECANLAGYGADSVERIKN